MAPKKTPPEVRFWAKVQKTDSCWLWTAAKDKDGYDVFGPSSTNRSIRAHTFLVGKAPDGLVWDHLCRIRNCVRPDHLEAVDPIENLRRGVGWELKTECAQGHPWIPENIRQDSRQQRCILCERATNRARYVADPDSARQRVRDYYAANREKRLAYAKQYAHRSRSKPCETPGCDNPKAAVRGAHYCEECRSGLPR